MCVLQAGPAAATAMSPLWINGRYISFVLKPGKQTLPMLIFLFFFKKKIFRKLKLKKIGHFTYLEFAICNLLPSSKPKNSPKNSFSILITFLFVRLFVLSWKS